MESRFILVLILPFLSACGTPQHDATQENIHPLVRLTDSVSIIRELVAQKKLNELLEPHSTEQLELLINNFSPAQMAFEAEVLTTTMPLVFVYYYEETAQEQAFIQQLEALAIEYDGRVKFVVVDADALFSLAQDVDIATFPALIVAQNRDILETITENITLDLIHQLLTTY